MWYHTRGAKIQWKKYKISLLLGIKGGKMVFRYAQSPTDRLGYAKLRLPQLSPWDCCPPRLGARNTMCKTRF